MNIIKTFFVEFVERTRNVINSKRAELNLTRTAVAEKIDKTAKVIIGNTTYIISSFFKKDAKGNVVDKISRMIEREAENITED